MSKLIINYCTQEHISPNDLMVLYAITYKVKIPFYSTEEKVISKNKLINLEYLNDKGYLTNKGSRLIVEYTEALKLLEGKALKTNKYIDDAILEARISDFIEDYRKLFKGKKPGSMGDLQGCKDKMLLFFKEYAEFADKELILAATFKYIESVNDYTYLKQADYFIYKHDNNKKRISMLAAMCEEVEDNYNVEQYEKNEMI